MKTIQIDSRLESLIKQGVPDPVLGHNQNRLLQLLNEIVDNLNELIELQTAEETTTTTASGG